MPERTFLEKIFLLHEEFSKTTKAIRVERLSRYLYDVYQLSKTAIAKNALNDADLYETIVNHRYHFTRIIKVELLGREFLNELFLSNGLLKLPISITVASSQNIKQ